MKKSDNGKRKIYIPLLMLAIITIGVMIGLNVIQYRLLSETSGDAGENVSYEYHIAMITGNYSDIFWQSVYKEAHESGMELGMYVEDFGIELNEEYSVLELMEMAIAAKVDGIIVEADNSVEMQEMIQKANSQSTPIPVITIGNDATGSERKGFVGANNYALGEKYGNQILALPEEKLQNVVVLMPNDSENAQPNLIYSGINEALMKSDQEVRLTTVFTNENDEFETEEKIRDLLIGTEKRPNVVVCLNMVDTISTYQCLVDYNLVGVVEMIGNGLTPEIADGIQKGIINASVATNASEMGKTAVRGMYEYVTEEYVSDYTPVKSELITKENVGDHIEKDEK
ncbi:substrate-binding domain-containing protein [Lachnospiraceae bacterium OttesenSCG-928-E19]|nr:substrate-binding domain-containing protein [Lachnospiraceae bacterium OttesenSCG-928-E19]